LAGAWEAGCKCGDTIQDSREKSKWRNLPEKKQGLQILDKLWKGVRKAAEVACVCNGFRISVWNSQQGS
jgi:hypothetical protein